MGKSGLLKAAAIALIPCLLTACGGGSRGAGKPAAAEAIRYSGPAVPGLGAKPLWMAASPGIIDVVGFGDAFAVLTGSQGYQVTVFDAATGRVRNRHQFAADPDPGPLSLRPKPQLLLDEVSGRPVVVIRYSELIAASGTRNEHTQPSDLAIDTEGRQVWRSPVAPSPGDAQYFDSGYAISHTETEGTPDKESEGITVFQRVGGGQVVRVPSAYTGDDVEDVTAGIAVMRHKSADLLNAGLRGVDLRNGGKGLWMIDKVKYIGTFGGRVLLSMNEDAHSGLEVVEPATGRRRASARPGNVGECERTAYDAVAGTVMCRSEGHLTIVDATTGDVRWRQESGYARDLRVKAAGGGVAYPRTEPVTDGTDPVYLALDSRTGQVLADNLPLQSIALSDSGHALIEYGGNMYGFRVKGTN